MGYVETAFSKDDTKVSVSIRGKVLPAQITKMPFVVNRE
jgi:glycine cleavage system aminomethyltransferase T